MQGCRSRHRAQFPRRGEYPVTKTCKNGHEYMPGRGCPVCMREYHKQKSKEFYGENKQHSAAVNKAWGERNKDKRTSYADRHRRANLSVYTLRQSQRIALKAAATIEPFTTEEWQEVIEFYSGLCAYCEMAEWSDMEHVVPLSKGGAHALFNLVPSCRSCNNRKYTQTWQPKREHPRMVSKREGVA